ncbi:hypothetical protein [Halorussus caseinilyticus]|uniref:ArsR family transcriptional regulator n=1 Tax=Halorussus caseinilyticus TaxID=3034025 RepID=A0ABD5WPY4_9EURY|nr:hypothetical protein [Halorussus sp. DT72]
MAENSENPLLTVLFYGQLSCVVAAVAVWIAVLFGPLVNPWFFPIMAVGAVLGLVRAYVGKQQSDEAKKTVIQGEAGVLHALAVENRPITARALSNILPHTLPDMKYRLQRLEEKDLIGATERDGVKYYYVKSTESATSSEETTDASMASSGTSEQSDDRQESDKMDDEKTELETE